MLKKGRIYKNRIELYEEENKKVILKIWMME